MIGICYLEILSLAIKQLMQRQTSCILVSKAGAQYMGFFGFSPDLKMRACSGVVFVKYHRHLMALWRQDI